MDCESFHTDLPDLIYGELTGERKQAGEAHMASCTSCTELVSDLQTVRTAQKQHSPSPLLGAKIKLSARDELLEEPHTPVLGRGGTLHLATVGVLAACVCLAGFALGIAYERGRDAPPMPYARKTPIAPPKAPLVNHGPETIEISHDRPREPGPGVEIRDGEPPRGPSQRYPEASQRHMEDAARSHLAQGDWTQAREFFLAAVEAAPKGPRAAWALAGAAESLLRAGNKAKAREEIEDLRRRIMADDLPGDSQLLQRLLELSDEAQD